MKLFVPFLFVAFAPFLGISQPNIQELERYLERARKEWRVPGMSVAIVKDGRVVSNKGYGVLEEGERQPVDEHTLFAIASNTKAFVSSAIGILHKEGKLHLEDKVRQYIPEFQLYDPYVSNEITIADLLCHRVGLGTYSGDVVWYKSNFTVEEVIEKIRYVPQKFSFRAGYGYSNLMFITAGEVIKRASGVPWRQFVGEKFLKPLGMNRTITSTAGLEANGNFASPHKPVDGVNHPIPWVQWNNMGAGGGIISSSHDMAKWLIFQLQNGVWESDTILDPKIQNILWTPHNNYVVSQKARGENPGTNFAGYGLGWGVRDYYGYRLITHGGAYDGMYSQVALMPELDLGIVILTNTMKGITTPLRNYLLNAYIKKDLRDWSKEVLEKSVKKSVIQKAIEAQKRARVANTKPSFGLESYTGIYLADMHGSIRITLENDELLLTFDSAPKLSAKLVHWHYDTWEIKWNHIHAWFDFGTIQFHHDNNMNIIGFEFDVPNEDIFFNELIVRKVE